MPFVEAIEADDSIQRTDDRSQLPDGIADRFHRAGIAESSKEKKTKSSTPPDREMEPEHGQNQFVRMREYPAIRRCGKLSDTLWALYIYLLKRQGI